MCTKVVTKKFTVNWSLGSPFLVLLPSDTFPTISPSFMSIMGTAAITSAFFPGIRMILLRKKEMHGYSVTYLIRVILHIPGYYRFFRPLYVHYYSYKTFWNRTLSSWDDRSLLMEVFVLWRVWFSTFHWQYFWGFDNCLIRFHHLPGLYLLWVYGRL